MTLFNTESRHKSGSELSIGKPVPNTNVYILDENENPVPIGQTGLSTYIFSTVLLYLDFAAQQITLDNCLGSASLWAKIGTDFAKVWVGGAAVSRGYLNLPELTSTRYKYDKFQNDE